MAAAGNRISEEGSPVIRDLKIDVTLKARGLTATQRIGTFDTDKTCITEAKLHY